MAIDQLATTNAPNKSKKLIKNDVTAVLNLDRIIVIHESRIYLLVNQHACGKSHHFHE